MLLIFFVLVDAPGRAVVFLSNIFNTAILLLLLLLLQLLLFMR